VGLQAAGETGVLEVRAAGVRTDVTLRRGSPVFAEGGQLRQTLGRLLLRRGEISEQDYVRVIDRMTEQLIRNETVRMGEVLVELGILSPAEVYEALERQIREKIVDCFQWPEVECAFRPLDAAPEDLSPFRVPPVAALVLEGVKTHFDAERLRPLLDGDAARFPVLADDWREVTRLCGLSPGEQKLLRGISGERTLAELRGESALDPLHSDQVLAALLLAGKLELRAERARPAAAPRPKPEVRAPSPMTGPAPRRPEPARTEPAPPPPGAAESAQAAERARLSLEALRKAPARAAKPAPPPPDAKQARLEAEQAFRRGQRMLEQNLLGAALRELAQAVELQREQPEYALAFAWAEYLAAKGEEQKALAKTRACAAAKTLLGQDRGSARAHTILGRFLYEEGELDAAERHFRVATQSAPNDREVQRWLRLIEGRRKK
jgi:tetratricopeptide (TPR) repeat protein